MLKLRIISASCFLILFVMFSTIPMANAASVSLPSGSAVPGCEETNECFIPTTITITKGETVTWSNDDTAAHTVTSGSVMDFAGDGNSVGAIFDSSIFMAGDTFSHTFDNTGNYDYFCMVHPWMIGNVIVQSSSLPTPPPAPQSESSTYQVSQFSVAYSISGGSILSMVPDPVGNSLFVGISTSDYGSVTLELPRSLIDAKMGNSDDTFFVLVDGEEVNFRESKTSSYRTLTINFAPNSDDIEIIGTFVSSGSSTQKIYIEMSTYLSIDQGSTPGYVAVFPEHIPVDGGFKDLNTDSVSIYVDGTFIQKVSTNEWSEIWTGGGSHTIKAVIPDLTVSGDPQQNIYRGSESTSQSISVNTGGDEFDPSILLVLIVIGIIVAVVGVTISKRKKAAPKISTSEKKPKRKRQAKPKAKPDDKPQVIIESDDTQFWVCPNCGTDTVLSDGKQYCPNCKKHL